MVSGQTFQFNHIHLGLTYPQANGLTKTEIETFFKDWKYQTRTEKCITISKYVIALESHQPTEVDPIGGIHYHCYVKFSSILRARDTFLFDIEDIMGKVYHPHVDKVRGIKNMMAYITKEDPSPLANFNFVAMDAKPDFDKILETHFDTPKDFLEYMTTNYPAYTFRNYISLRTFAYDHYNVKIKLFIPKYVSFPNVPHACKAWVDCYLFNDEMDRPLSLILIGASRTGKTAWARSLGRHMYFNTSFNLDIWDDEALYVIFDDFDKKGKKLEEYFPQWKSWFGAQEEFTVTDKYRRKERKEWGKPMIFITNNEIECESSTMDYIKRNSIIVHVHSEFY